MKSWKAMVAGLGTAAMVLGTAQPRERTDEREEG